MKPPVRLFKLDAAGKMTKEFEDDCEWVLSGEGYGGRLWNGMKCRVSGKRLKAAFLADPDNLPAGFEPAHEEPLEDGRIAGWIPVSTTDPQFEFHRDAWHNQQKLPDGLYDLVGPRINGNIENISENVLVRQSIPEIPDIQRDFAGIRNYLSTADIHGIMFEHPDGRRAYVLTKDFGLKRKNESALSVNEPPKPQHGLVRELNVKIAQAHGEISQLKTEKGSLESELAAARKDLLQLQERKKNKPKLSAAHVTKARRDKELADKKAAEKPALEAAATAPQDGQVSE